MRILIVLLACAFNIAHAEEFNAKVIAVLDGDTVLVLRGQQKIKIRLSDIDAPEVGHAGMGVQPPNSQKAQDYGMASRKSLIDRVLKKQVQVNSRAVDDYGRLVAKIRLDGRSVNEEQVRRGMAWEYSHFHSDARYLALQREAQQARRGLWSMTDPQPPWQWRKAHANTPSQSALTPVAACGSKRRCAQMTSCDEARFYFTQCGVKSLDGNGDGVPCEALCGGSSGKH
ncbi:MAG: thermonuclease family protein [Nitrosomonadales bacterium]|nr:thermonuclease family protein [Nitrosomonadales bacterium]